jgi:hypothetical protein
MEWALRQSQERGASLIVVDARVVVCDGTAAPRSWFCWVSWIWCVWTRNKWLGWWGLQEYSLTRRSSSNDDDDMMVTITSHPAAHDQNKTAVRLLIFLFKSPSLVTIFFQLTSYYSQHHIESVLLCWFLLTNQSFMRCILVELLLTTTLFLKSLPNKEVGVQSSRSFQENSAMC